jgi:hypothetical protein
MKLVLVILGALGGFGVGYATRPTLLGMPLPLDLLTSNYPMDAEPKSMLMSHLAITTAVGLAVGVGLAIIVSALTKSRGAQ